MSINEYSANEGEHGVSLLDIALIIKKHRRFILLFTIIAIAVIMGVLTLSSLLPPEKSFFPDVYSPQAIVLVSDGSSSGSFSSALASSSGLGSLLMKGSSSSSGQLALLLAKTDPILDDLIQTLDFYKNFPKMKRSQLRAILYNGYKLKLDDDTSTITISYKAKNPQDAQKAVNGMVDILEKRFFELNGSKNSSQKVILENKLKDVTSAIKEYEQRIKDFQNKYGVFDVETFAQEQATVLAELRSKLILKDIEIENYAAYAKTDDPAYLKLKVERSNIQAQLNQLEKGTSKKSVMMSQRQLPDVAFKYAELERDLKVQEEIYKTLTQQYELAKLGDAGQLPTFQVIQYAEVLDAKTGPNKKSILVAGAFISLLLAILGVFGAEFLNRLRADGAFMAKWRGEE
jgi:uncharacterized protein involved in exopolysaccharide biosynthesis